MSGKLTSIEIHNIAFEMAMTDDRGGYFFEPEDLDKFVAEILAAQQQAEPATHSEDGRDICAAGDLRGEFLGCSFSQFRMERGIKLSLDDGVLSILLTDDQPARQVGGGDVYSLADKIRTDLDRQACPNSWMVIAYEACVKHASAALAPAAVAAVLPEPYGWIAAGEFFRLRQYAIDAAEKTPCIEVYSRQQMLGLNRRAIPAGLLEKAADLLKGYQQVIDGCHSSEIERFDYQPEVQGTADELRALLGKGD